MPCPKPDDWTKWWAANRDDYGLPADPKPPAIPERGATSVAYHGLRVTSDHVAFLTDRSGDMAKPLQDGRAKEAAAREELARTLERLPEGILFNVYAYGERVTAFRKEPVPLDERTRQASLAFLAGQPLGGRKNTWAALESVLADEAIDTIYLLSSGEPEVGLYVHWNRLTAHLRDRNRFHGVVVHTVAYSDSEWYRDQLRKIAEATGGAFVAEE